MLKPSFVPDYRTRDLMVARLRELRPALEAQGIRHAALFGSVARGDDVPESDVDIILDVDPDRHIGLFEFMDIRQFLELQLGRAVDLGSMRSLRLGGRENVLAELADVF